MQKITHHALILAALWPALCCTLGVEIGLGFQMVAAAEKPDLSAPHVPLNVLDYALMSVVLQHGLGANIKQVVIADITATPALPKENPAKIAERAADLGTTPELMQRWTELSAEHVSLARQFKLPAPYTLLSESDRDLLFRGDDLTASWHLFFARFADAPGLIRVSRPAYDKTQQEALIYVEFDCGATCGSGNLLRVTRRLYEPWQVVAGLVLWMADTPAVSKPPEQKPAQKTPVLPDKK